MHPGCGRQGVLLAQPGVQPGGIAGCGEALPRRPGGGRGVHVRLVLAGRCVCQREGIAFVLGHALYMGAIHGGKAKNDKIDAHKIAGLLRGGMLAQAYVYPPQMRATRDLLRRRCHLMHKRSELITHIQNTVSQYNLPPLEHRIAEALRPRGAAGALPRPSGAQLRGPGSGHDRSVRRAVAQARAAYPHLRQGA